MSWIRRIFRISNVMLQKAGDIDKFKISIEKKGRAAKIDEAVDIPTAYVIVDEAIRKYYGGSFSKIALPQLMSSRASKGDGIPLDMLPKGKKLWGAIAGLLGMDKLLLGDELLAEITLFHNAEVDSILNEKDLFALFNFKLIDLRKIQNTSDINVKRIISAINNPLAIPVCDIQTRKNLLNLAVTDLDKRQVITRSNMRIIKLKNSIVCKDDKAAMPHPKEIITCHGN